MERAWRSDLVWGAIATTIIGYEAYTIRSNKLDSTLTRTTRRAFRVKHPVGKAAFALGWGWFSVWFMRHILEAEDPMDALLHALTPGDHDAT